MRYIVTWVLTLPLALENFDPGDDWFSLSKAETNTFFVLQVVKEVDEIDNWSKYLLNSIVR
jgi:hypothetical protein